MGGGTAGGESYRIRGRNTYVMTFRSRSVAPNPLRLGRPVLSWSIRKLRLAAGAMLFLALAAIVSTLAIGRDPYFCIVFGLIQLVIAAGFLATARCEMDVQAGHRSKWAYSSDWIQGLAVIAAAIVLIVGGQTIDFVLGWMYALSVPWLARLFILRRRRARKLDAFDAAMGTTFE